MFLGKRIDVKPAKRGSKDHPKPQDNDSFGGGGPDNYQHEQQQEEYQDYGGRNQDYDHQDNWQQQPYR